MSLETQQQRLRRALAALEREWEAAGLHWRDAVRQEFARKYWTPLPPLVRAALSALERLGQAKTQCAKDCS